MEEDDDNVHVHATYIIAHRDDVHRFYIRLSMYIRLAAH